MSLASLVFDTTVVALESQAGLFTGRSVFCRLGKNDQWQHILKTDWEFCNFVCDCHQCHDELHCPWVQDRSGEQKQILEAQNRLEMVSVIFNMTKKTAQGEMWSNYKQEYLLLGERDRRLDLL